MRACAPNRGPGDVTGGYGRIKRSFVDALDNRLVMTGQLESHDRERIESHVLQIS
jgi:hypothetical protein